MQLLAVNYHYFREKKYQNGIYPLSLQEFSNQIDELSKYYNFISQEDLSNKIINNQFDNKNYCLLTFDDGLKEQMLALELLNKKGIPGLFYVTTDSIKNNSVVDVHKLHYIRSVMTDNDVYKFIDNFINLEQIKYPDNINELYRYDTLETKKLKYLLNFILEPKIKEEIISKLFSTLVDETQFSKELYMNINDIRKINSFGYLGTHTNRHLPLATLSNTLIKEEIQSSLDFLSSECKIDNIKSISYPYGGAKAVNDIVAQVSSDFSFYFGLTMFRGINSKADFKNPFLLKRVDTNDAPGGKLQSTEFCI